MTTYSITGTADYSALTPAPADDTDTFDIQTDGTLTCSQSTVKMLIMWCNNRFKKFHVTNTSTTTPIFPRFSAVGSSKINGGGNFVFDGDYIPLGTADGVTTGITYVPPTDAAGAKYIHIPFLMIDGKMWKRVTSLANMYADERGEHYTYNGTTITFGDGTNGKIPSGLVQIANIEVQFNGAEFTHDNSISTVTKATWCDIDLRNGGKFFFTDAAIYNNTQIFIADLFLKSAMVNFLYSGDASNNCRLRIPVGTHQNINLLSANTTSGDVFLDDGPYTITNGLRVDIITQKATTFARLKINLNGSSIDVLESYGGTSTALSLNNGVNGGTIGELKYSTGYLRTDTMPWTVCYVDGGGQNQYINKVTRTGSEAWSAEMEFFLHVKSGNMNLTGATLPADSSFDELIRVETGGSGSADDITLLGVSNSATRDINNYSSTGFTFSNIKTTDTSFGNQPAINADYNFVSINGQTFAPAFGMRSSIVYKNTAYDEGEIVFQPFYDATNSATAVIAGDGADTFNIAEKFYTNNTTVKISIESDWLAGVDAINTLTLGGANTGNFTIEFKLKVEGGEYPAGYTALTLSNFQTAFSGLSLASSSVRWKAQYTIIRTAGTVSGTYLSGIFIGCDIDSSYVWTDSPEMMVTFTGLTVGDYIYVENAAGDKKFYFQASSTTEVVEISGLDHGQTYKRVVDIQGKVADVGTFTVVSGGSLSIPIVLSPLTRADGQAMYAGTTDPSISIDFNFTTPQASIVIGDKVVSLQACFDAVEDALITESGMKWNSAQGSLVKFNSVAASGKILSMGDDWRLKSDSLVSLNSGTDGYVESTQGIVVDGANGDVRYSNSGGSFSDDDRVIAAEIHEELGLSGVKTITENVVDSSYDESTENITKEIRVSGNITTVTRTT